MSHSYTDSSFLLTPCQQSSFTQSQSPVLAAHSDVPQSLKSTKELNAGLVHKKREKLLPAKFPWGIKRFRNPLQQLHKVIIPCKNVPSVGVHQHHCPSQHWVVWPLAVPVGSAVTAMWLSPGTAEHLRLCLYWPEGLQSLIINIKPLENCIFHTFNLSLQLFLAHPACLTCSRDPGRGQDVLSLHQKGTRDLPVLLRQPKAQPWHQACPSECGHLLGTR